MRALFIALLAAAAFPSSALAADAQLVKVGDFASPVYAAAPPGDPSRLFVVERAGTVQLLSFDGTRKTFIDATGEVGTVAGESGLLSMAFAPDYATSGRFYLYVANDVEHAIKILEYQRSASNPETADLATRRAVLTIGGHDAGNHWGGTLAFGPDGLLYLAPGDNAKGSATAQDDASRFGKLLRLDAAAGAEPQVVALGLRNPFRFSFDRLTGDLALADVGQSTHEEVDYLTPAQLNPPINFGWQICEGVACSGPPPTNYVAPVLDYTHAPDGNCSITGGVVVRDPSLTALAGRYVYADLCKGILRSAVLQQPAATGDAPVALTGTPSSLQSPAGFGQDATGCVYVATLGDNALYRIAPPGGPATCLSAPATTPPGGGGGDNPPGDNPPGGGTPTATTPTPTPTPTKLSAAGQQKQRILRQTGIRIGVRCAAACTVRTRGTVRVGKKSYKLARVALKITTANRTVVLVIPLSKKTKAVIAKALRKGRTALASVQLSARGLDGGLDSESRRARLVR